MMRNIMNPIISSSTNLIPFYPAVQCVNAPWQFDLWAAIAQVGWVNRDDNVEPQLNPQCPSQVWQHAKWLAVREEAQRRYTALSLHFQQENFWRELENFDADARESFTWHIVARGENIYNAVMSDVKFGYGYCNQDCGFREFISEWR